MLRKEHGGQENKDASDEILYKIDIPANRYDMLCLEGIARALNIFNRTAEVPQYKLADMSGVASLLIVSAHLHCMQYGSMTSTGLAGLQHRGCLCSVLLKAVSI